MTELLLDETHSRRCERHDRRRLSLLAYGRKEADRLRKCRERFVEAI